MISSISGFYLMAGVIGLVQGGVQSVSRAVFSKWSLKEKILIFWIL